MKPVDIARAVAANRSGAPVLLREEASKVACPTCSELATFLDVFGQYWCSNGHQWTLPDILMGHVPSQSRAAGDGIDDLNAFWVYRFVRLDLPERQHVIQVGHASWHAGMEFGAVTGYHPGIPYNITCGVDDLDQLLKVARKLSAAEIKYHLFLDDEVDPDPTALVTFPVTAEQRNKYFARYRTYSPPSSSLPEHETGFDAGRGAISEATEAVDKVMGGIPFIPEGPMGEK